MTATAPSILPRPEKEVCDFEGAQFLLRTGLVTSSNLTYSSHRILPALASARRMLSQVSLLSLGRHANLHCLQLRCKSWTPRDLHGELALGLGG